MVRDLPDRGGAGLFAVDDLEKVRFDQVRIVQTYLHDLG
jgi:hypothetical protein